MKLLKLGSTGNDVKKWQYFLIGQKLYFGLINGKFDEATFESTKSFQKKHNLNPDGVVDNYTVGQAMLLGFGLVVDEETDLTSDSYPQKPNSPPRSLQTTRDKNYLGY